MSDDKIDAERYRWLREGRSIEPVNAPGYPWAVHVVTEHGMPTLSPCLGAQLDRLIDEGRRADLAGDRSAEG